MQDCEQIWLFLSKSVRVVVCNYPNLTGSLCFAVFLFRSVPADGVDVRCENVYRDFSECVLELGESMDNYQENVTSERGVEAVCR